MNGKIICLFLAKILSEKFIHKRDNNFVDNYYFRNNC